MKELVKIKKILQQRFASLKFALFFAFFLFLFVSVPAWTIVGNDYAFQLSTYNTEDYILLAVLALLSALIWLAQIKILNDKKTCSISTKRKSILTSIYASLSTLFSSILGTAVCASCITPIMLALGLNFSATLFLLKYNTEIVLALVFLNLILLYYLLRKIN